MAKLHGDDARFEFQHVECVVAEVVAGGEIQRQSDDERAFATIAYQHDIEALASARNHRLERWIISHQGRAAGRCATCGARAYVDITTDSPIADGEVLDHDCPGYWAPSDGFGQ